MRQQTDYAIILLTKIYHLHFVIFTMIFSLLIKPNIVLSVKDFRVQNFSKKNC